MTRMTTAAALALAAMAMSSPSPSERGSQNTQARATDAGFGAAAAAAVFASLGRFRQPRYPRKTPDWSNARYRRAARKARAVARNRRAQR